MTWRLAGIALYRRRTQELHQKAFDTAGLSIISGESNRGKSALLRIVDYCLLSDDCRVPEGIRKRVSHVGIKIQKHGAKLVVVRRLPAEREDVPSTIYMLEQHDADFPLVAPATEWNKDFAKEKLSAFTGIAALPMLTSYTTGAEHQTPPNIRHCVPYLLQPQNIIANPELLFPGLEETNKKRAIADALPYFLGVATESQFAKLRELRGLRMQMNKIERERKEQQRLGLQGWERGKSLWSQAVALAMIPPRPEPQSLGDLLRTLGAVPATVETPPEAAAIEVRPFAEEERQARVAMQAIRTQMSEIDRYLVLSDQGQETTAKQLQRVRFRDLLPPAQENATCPLCGSDHVDASEIERTLESTVLALEETQSAPTRLRSQLETEREALKAKLNEQGIRASEARARREVALRDLARTSSSAQLEARAELRGRIKEYVSALTPRVTDELGANLADVNAKVSALEAEVGDEATEYRRGKALVQLRDIMTNLSTVIDVEYRGAPTQLNFNTLQVEVLKDAASKRWTPLTEIGGAANWVGYHIIACIGLHRFFSSQNSPVPGLLMIDQPSQAWFPAEAGVEWSADHPRDDAETRSITKIVDALHALAASPGAPQIIVMEHAELRAESFRRSVQTPRWRGAIGLMPAEWVADADEESEER